MHQILCSTGALIGRPNGRDYRLLKQFCPQLDCDGFEFILYSTGGVYRYEVTRILADWRSSVSKNYVDNMTISPDVCYIITCGRDNFLVDGKSSRYKDFIVEGHLKEKLSLTEYARQIYGEEEEWRE